MCGIVGALAFDAFEKKSEEKQRTEASIFITTQLLQMTVERGKDATGIGMLWADGNYNGLKMGIPSPSFIARFGEKETEFKGMLKLWREYPKLCRVFLGHCRKASKGNSYDNKNNHPLLVGDIMYVHNGTLTNDDIIFEKLGTKRAGEVDSEAIGHLLSYYTDGGKEPFTKEVVDEVTRRLSGTYSVLAVSGNNPYQAVQFRDGRPAEMALVKPLKTVFIASEKKYLENVLFEYNKMTQLFTATDMPYLKKDDVEFKTLQDDSYAIWDFTVPITDETTIDDLHDWGKTPLRADKVWKDSGTTTTTWNGNNNYNYNQSSKKTVGTQVTAQSTKTKTNTTNSGVSDDDDDPGDGLVWSKALNKYKTQNSITKSKSYGAVEIDIDKGSITHVGDSADNSDKEVFSLTEVDKEKVENLIAGAAKTSELAIANVSDAVEKVKKTGISGDEDGNKSSIVEIDMTTDSPEAVSAASKYVEGGLPKFENEDEVLDALDLDGTVLKNLPIYAVANRIMKYVFQKGFIAGFMIAKADEDKKPESDTTPAIDQRKTKKLESSEKKIRALKAVLKIMGASLKEVNRSYTEAVGEDSATEKSDTMDLLMDVISNTFKPDAIKRVNLSDAFSVGDMKEIPMLEEVAKAIESESR